jgi:uncharacterized membrane protein YfhO
LLLFTIPFDKGWSAEVDGKKQKIYIVDVGFMGILLNKGPHTIRLIFSPQFFMIGMFLSAISLAVFLITIFLSFKKHRQNIRGDGGIGHG